MRRALLRPAWAFAALCASLVPGAASPAIAAAEGHLVPPPDPGVVAAQLVQDVGGRGASQAPQRYAYLQKIDGHLQGVAAARLGAGSTAAARSAAALQGLALTPAGAVGVDVYVRGDVARAAEALRAAGMQVEATSDHEPERVVEGFLSPAALPGAAALATTRAVVASYRQASTGSVLSQGDLAISGPAARALGPHGAGVPVGIISDSINQVGNGIADSGDNLPPGVQVLSEQSGGTDEGRAMAEIVYDEAPGVSRMVFAGAQGGPVAKAGSIAALVASGVKVIADDTSYFAEPFFQDGVLSQAVDNAKAAGVAYFIAAGNDGDQGWQGTYSGGATQDFDPGPAVDLIQTVGTVDNGETVHLVLQWAEPWGHATTDFAVDVYQIVAGTPTLAFTVDDLHLASGLPEEVVGVSASGGSVTFGIAIRRVAGSGSPLLKYIDFTNGAGTVAIEGGANSGSVAPDAASSRGALTVAASPYGTPDSPEDFSSRGPVVRLFDAGGTPLATPETRHKPDLAAPDGVDTSVPGFDATTPFFGTSAATPAAAGIAALILSAKPAMGVDELYAIMTSPDNTLDCVVPGTPADACGAGFLLADRAVSMALDATPPVIAPAASPALPDGANGWYVGPVTVTWSVGDDESPVVAPTGCGSSAPGDGVTQLTCSATSAGGTASLPLTIKRDSTPPSAPRITGIQAKAYTPATVPKTTALACSATDDASGVDLCSVAGLASGIGRHTLTATATNGAGLTATSTLTYAVVKPAAISGLKLARTLTLAKLATSGVPLTVHVAAASTTLTIRIVLRIPRPSGGARTVVLGNSAKRLPTGTVHLGIRLSAKARRDLRGARRATLAITVTGRSPGAQNQVLKASLKARR